jgi:hypothetical protein
MRDSRAVSMTKNRSRKSAVNLPDVIAGHVMDSSKAVKAASSLNIDFSSINDSV